MFVLASAAASSLLLAISVSAAPKSLVAPQGAEVLTVAVFGDYGWTGWIPAPDHFCLEVMADLKAAGITVPNELVNDCDPGDKAYINNATALQTDTANYIGQVCTMKNCSAIISVGDNFYDSGVDFTTGGILRFEEAWVNMYAQGVFRDMPWYQCLGNHDVVKGQAGVDFETKILPYYDDRWNFGTSGLPYWTYHLVGSNWTATFVVVDSDCFLSSYQKNTSVYYNEYTIGCHKNTSVQVDFLNQTFSNSKADWKFLQLHHPYMSSATNQTDLAPLIQIVEAHKGIVLNGHDHCLGHYYNNNTNFILSGAAGYPQGGDCNNGIPLGPFTKFLAANNNTGANGLVTMDISSTSVNVEYYVRDMLFINGDLYPVAHDLMPSYKFQITQKSI
ncbi:tartrate-resistant acid phosphatase type 5 precursor [Dacryopinax primogenitus]|uniref:Tartrate-resistant acid phosphatase type 5 n=1 Tax=Dacryopinax primogenitus (strain DJM 731) TaxID=1858805 RepID=M5FPA4_DACPD|nr:tartrate-resistant acid phosphatase type 5 precursor [Dacryopinax primogenitus]EJT96923.1 tartrate-resistant acid phosphatase type 5 precursor [Dacryopinax primogenitus]